MSTKNLLRHVSFSSDAKASAKQAAENARDANFALTFAVAGYYRVVNGYAALGTTDARIGLTGNSARAVMCVLCRPTNDPGGNIQPGVALNFGVINGALSVCEPSGLVADTLYDLTFLVLE